MGFIIGLGIGIGIGWVMAEKPEWARNLTDNVTAFVKGGKSD